MSQEEFQSLLQFFRALADENRLKLLGILAHGERSVEELAALLDLKAPTVSHHLARLKALNLVGMRSDGNTHYYWLNIEALHDSQKHLLTPERVASLVDTVEGDAWERKVIKDFFEGSRLKEIPASRKKRSVILRWLALQFNYGVLYKEASMNEILQRHHPDSASLRRELISPPEGLMQREQGLYWRIPSGASWQAVALSTGDGMMLQGRLGIPAGEGPFPTILEIHEGPGAGRNSMWLSPLSQLWVEHGFAYCVFNYRKPEPGEKWLSFRERIAGQPGSVELADVQCVRSWLIAQQVVDPRRLLLVGWSYSASLALLALGRQVGIWAGAIAGAVVTNWELAYEEATDKAPIQELFGGSPEEKAQQYRESSPITYVEQVTAPVLLLQPRAATFSTPRQSRSYWERMEALGKTCELQSVPAHLAALDIEQMVACQEYMLHFAQHILATS